VPRRMVAMSPSLKLRLPARIRVSRNGLDAVEGASRTDLDAFAVGFEKTGAGDGILLVPVPG
jgi:hypothetical protein